MACVPLAFLLHFGGGGLRAMQSAKLGLLLVRAVLLLLVSYTTYYLAIANLPLAVAVALFFAAPSSSCCSPARCWAKRCGRAQIVAVVVGFVGVLVICFGPSFMRREWRHASTACCDRRPCWRWPRRSFYGLAALMARQLADTESGAVMASYQNLVFSGRRGGDGARHQYGRRFLGRGGR